MELLFYDVEVFRYDSLIVIKDINNNVLAECWSKRTGYNDANGETGFEKIESVIENNILVGYNNYSYDDHILKLMRNFGVCYPETIKERNDQIIAGAKFDATDYETIDCFQQISLAHPSLKMIEGNMGKSIIESEIPFDIDRPLTEEEKRIVEKYCEYDVENTIEVYKLRYKSYFESKEYLNKMLGNDKPCKYNTTTMVASILAPDGLKKWHRIDLPEEFNRWLKMDFIPEEVSAMWDEMLISEEKALGKGKKKTISAYDCEFVFGMGGLHAAPKKPGRYTNVKLADVGSMYPSIIVKMNALGEATKLYDSIRRERLEIKHKDKVRANALKLILNSTYGLLKNKYSKLYNPYASAMVCIFGQIVLFKLCGMLHEAGYRIMNVNTDGVAFEDTGTGYEEICKKWEDEVDGLVLEIDEFDEWIQKDVNNYVARQDGHIKVKGGDVNKYAEDHLFDNNNARIIYIAIVEKLMNNVPVYKTVHDNIDNPSLYQYILRPGGTYTGTCDQDGNLMPQKVNRVFATTEENPYRTRLYKLRPDGGKVLYADAPVNMYLYNGNLSELKNFGKIVDVDHYIDIINKKLGGWVK